MKNIETGCPIFVFNVVRENYATTLSKFFFLQTNVNISGFEADGKFKTYLPPILPEGTMKLSLHIHTHDNKTVADIAILTEVKTLGISDRIKLG